MKKLLLCLVLFLTGCAQKEIVSNENSSIVYEIFPYSYCDSDGNGVGDLQGIISKLDYVQSLGVGAIWLTPICESTTYHMYDVVDYYKVNPLLGTMEDFESLVQEAKNRHIDIYFDLVINHTSKKNQWFIDASNDVLTIDTSAVSKADWYNFTNEKLNGYTFLGKNIYYESGFDSNMPDLNLDNLEVRNEIKKIVEFWLDKGVKGFRLDAPYHYYAGNTTKNNEFLTWLNSIAKDVFIVGEVWASQNIIVDHYESGIDSFFNFGASSTNGQIATTIRSSQGMSLANFFANHNQEIKQKNNEAIDSVFLSNHDQGRSASYFPKQPEKTKLMASVLLLSPGRPFIYYGEEIGMKGTGVDPNKRLGMVWSLENKEEIPYAPPGADYVLKMDASVEEQLKDEQSLLSHYQNVANMRNKSTLFELGNVEAMDLHNRAIYALKHYNENEALVVLHNFSDQQQIISLDEKIVSIDTFDKKNKLNNQEITLQPYSSVVVYVER